MEAMLLMLLAAAFTVLGLAAQAWGVDSRDGSGDPRRSDYPVGLQ